MKKLLTILAVLMIAVMANANHHGLAVENPEIMQKLPKGLNKYLFEHRHDTITPQSLGRGAGSTHFDSMWVGKTIYLEGTFIPQGEHVIIRHLTFALVIGKDGKIIWMYGGEKV